MYREGDEPVPGYRLVQFLGRGQFGEVWRAESPGGTQAALKLIDLGRASGLKELRGIELLKKIRHAHLMPITAMWLLDRDGQVLTDDLFESLAANSKPDSRATMVPDAPAIDESIQPSYLIVAMVLADESLEDVLQKCLDEGEQGIPPQRLMRYMTEAAKAIDHLNAPIHDLGSGATAIQHCDIKPANIMLAGDSVMICDFGLARNFSALQNAVAATSLVGSPAYMPPECIEKKPSRSTDQYSLAITYCELASGRLPFHSEEYVAVLDAHRSGDLDLSSLSPAEKVVIRKATATNPEDRYPSTQEMVAALNDAVFGTSGAGKSSAGVFAFGFVIVLIGLAGVGYFTKDQWWPPDEEVAPGNGNGNGNGGGGEQQQPVNVAIRFQVIPATAVVRVNDLVLEPDSEGWVSTELPDGKDAQVAVSHADFESSDNSYSLAQLKDGLTIELLPSLEVLAAKANRALKAGQLEEAVESYRQLVRRDADTYAVIPAPQMTMDKHTKSVRCLTGGPSSFYSAGAEGKVYRLDLSSGKLKSTEVHDNKSDISALVTGGDVVASADLGGALVITAGAGNEEKLPGIDPVALAISADRKWLAAGDLSGTLRCWDLEAPDEEPTVIEMAHAETIEALAFVGSSDLLVSGAADDRTNAFFASRKLAKGPAIEVDERIEGDVTRIAASDDSIVFGGGQSDNQAGNSWYVVHRWHSDEGVRMLPGGHNDVVNCLAISADGTWIASGTADGYVGIWNMGVNQPEQAVPPRTHASGVLDVLLLTQHRLLVSCGADKQVCFLDLENPKQASDWKLPGHGGRVVAVAVTDDQRWLATACDDQNVRIWDLQRLLMIWKACQLEGVKAIPETGTIVRS